MLGNLALSCPRCNGYKLDHVKANDLDTGVRVPLFNPRTQSWSDHFQWAPEDPLILEGKTATGRATVACLQMNHPDMIVARSLLSILGLLHDSSD